MVYSHWESKGNMKDYLQKADYKKKVEVSGLPVIYESSSVYMTEGNGHSLVIGAAGSGKTQTMILPLIKLSMLAGESVVVNDPKGEIYELTAKEFEKRGYTTILLDFNNAKYGNYYNPLDLAYNLYKSGDKDKSMNVIDEVGYYIFNEPSKQTDPFWTNSTIGYFTGLCLYLFEESEKSVSLNDVFDLANELLDAKKGEEFLKKASKNKSVYANVCGTLEAPKETKGSIIATFNQKLRKFIVKENFSDMMSKTDFDFSKVANEKTIIYLVSGYYDYSRNLVPLFINQVFEVVDIYGKHDKKINVILDDFDNLLPIKNFSEIINYARGLKMVFTCVIRSFINLLNTYGKEDSQIIRLCFSNIVYLYANDLYTLEEVSTLCGNEASNKPLVSPEELKTLKQFEAIFLLARVAPFKTKLTPDYKIDWNINFEKTEFKLRK